MNKTKLFFVSFLLMVMVGVLAACGSDAEETSGGEDTQSESDSEASEEASNYPEKPIKIAVGFPAGGVTDTATRTIAEAMKKNLPNEVDVAVENKPGGGGVVAVTDIVNSDPDGYKIGFTPNGPLTIHTHYGNTAYKYDDPTLITQTIQSDFILAVHPDAPWDTFDELKEDVLANPGEISFGTPGAGSRPDLIGDALKEQTGMEMKSVPFQGNAPARTALMGKDVDAILLSETDVLPYVDSGEVKALMNFGEGHEGYPDIPVAQEEGYDINAYASFFFYGPKDLPADIVNILDKAIQKSMEDPEVQEAYDKVGFRLSHKGPEELKEAIDKEYEVLGALINGGE